jgi:predicted RNA-binding protein with PUA-like domain
MKKGDMALIYHSMDDKSVIGIAQITREHFADPKDAAWEAVEIKPLKKLKEPVNLADIKKDKRLSNMVLVKNSRLSVQPVKPEEFDIVIGMGEK